MESDPSHEPVPEAAASAAETVADEAVAPTTPTLRLWKVEDYPLLRSWWEGHSFDPVPLAILPPLGVIYSDKDGPKAAGWAYMDNGGCGVAMIEWLVTNPKAGLSGARALREVLRFLRSELARMDYGAILTTCKQPALARLLMREGFQPTDTGMIHLIHLQAQNQTHTPKNP